MQKTFDPHTIESHWYQIWENKGLFSAPDLTKTESSDAFSVMIPPPNVTGRLHMGHAFQATLIDTLIRWQRMQQHPTLWQMGTDHAGIATQMVVERQLAQQGQTRQTLGRDAFIEQVWQWKAESGGTIGQQLKRMGASLDWQRERFTMDPGFNQAVIKVFVQLYQEGLIYRGKRLVNWDPKLHTAISDLEVITAEEPGHLWHFRYPLAGKDTHLVIATTRPETLLGDTAVAVNPNDERYQDLIGQSVHLPLTDRTIPIIADDYVDPEFGTGCVKITPAHDFNDFAIGQRHELPSINILNPDATLNQQVPAAYQGMDRFVAREQVVQDLQALGLVENIEAYPHPIPRGDRSGSVIEPYLTEQWYVKTDTLAKPAIDAVEQGRIQFVPKNWENTYFAWMRDIQDWCISRQLWWGHRIPAWYDDNGHLYVGESETAIREQYGLADTDKLSQDTDVLDTWFSSALWTFATLEWPDMPMSLRGYHPSSVLVTGFDIIFFWVARMIMMTLKFTGEIPFHTVYVHGLVRDAQGQKMSKSKGNVLDPIDIIDGITLEALIEKRTQGMMQPHLAEAIVEQTQTQFPNGINAYGTDALRFTFLSLASTGRDIRFDIGRLEGYRNFCNKLWNAARFVLMNTNSLTLEIPDASHQHPIDRWILAELANTQQALNHHLHQYRFDLAAQALYDFVWEQFCDWYLELCKVRLYQTDNSATTQALQQHLLQLLEQILRLAHPMLPFITEEIWQAVKVPLQLQEDSIMQRPYPELATPTDAFSEVTWIKDFITKVRLLRADLQLPPGQKITIQVKGGSTQDQQWLTQFAAEIKQLGRIATIEVLATETQTDNALSQWLDTLEICLPVVGLIDIDAELQKLDKQKNQLEKELKRVRGKLDNPKFTSKAPAEVIAKEQAKQQTFEQQQAQLDERIALLSAAQH